MAGTQPTSISQNIFCYARLPKGHDFSDVQVVGEEIENTVIPHEFAYPFDEEKELPPALADLGVKGMRFKNRCVDNNLGNNHFAQFDGT